ncbi:transketolase, pyrimidine binding domain-containing protein [Ditylenchus destructor]|nr:transketolase, pyrimidine binding domain-containing protein [Ditylenchus destructor]
MFMEYARNAVRMAALMKKRVIHVYTHDSIGLGEDGPTHQPVEQLTSLRTTPNLDTWRPADAVESAVAWKHAIERKDGPSALIFSRQNLQHQVRTDAQIADISRGGYVLKDCIGEPELILISTGSEVGLTVQAYDKLTAQGRKRQCAYRHRSGSRRLLVQVRGPGSRVIGMTTYGESAPAPALFEEFGSPGKYPGSG